MARMSIIARVAEKTLAAALAGTGAGGVIEPTARTSAPAIATNKAIHLLVMRRHSRLFATVRSIGGDTGNARDMETCMFLPAIPLNQTSWLGRLWLVWQMSAHASPRIIRTAGMAAFCALQANDV